MADITLTSWTVLLIMSLVIPTAVGLLTKFNAPAVAKVLVNIVASSVAAVLVANADAMGGAVISRSTLNMAVVTTLISMLTYLGVYKPLGVTEKLAPEKGLG